MKKNDYYNYFGLIILLSLIFFGVLCLLLLVIQSPAVVLFSIVFVSYVSWNKGVTAGLILTALNHSLNGVAFRLLAPEYAESFPPEALISIAVHLGDSLLLGYFGKLAANLKKEIEVRKKAEEDLRKLQDELEVRIETRTRELEKANSLLNQARKLEAIGKLAGTIAHDFNNYLNIIIGYSILLVKKLDDTNPLFEYAKTIEKTAESASGLTSQLLTFARKEKYTLKLLCLNDITGELVPLLSSVIKNGITIEHRQEPALPQINGGADQIKSAILNLGLNARDAMKHGGTLTISTKTQNVTSEYCKKYGITCKPGVYAAVAVEDTGTGMPPEVFQHLFEPFFSTKEEKGTGMGLAAVYGIAQSHHGAVFAETTVGKGSCFTLLFPVEGSQSTNA